MYKQFCELRVKKDFHMRKNNKGKFVNALIGDLFFVTNPEHSQKDGIIIDRKYKAKINSGYLFIVEDVKEFFDVIGDDDND